MSLQQAPKNDGRILAEVMSDTEPCERFTLRIHKKHSRLGTTILVEYPDGKRETFGVVGILEPR